MTKLAEWLELKAQPFLAQPSAAMFSHSQGQKYQHYCRSPIITQEGLVASIGAVLAHQGSIHPAYLWALGYHLLRL